MTQDQWLVLALKAVLIADLLSLAGFAGQYQRLTRGAWRRDPIGSSLMQETFALLGVVGLTTASVFFQFNRLDSRGAAWIQIGLLGWVAWVLGSRIVVFQRAKNGPADGEEPDDDS